MCHKPKLIAVVGATGTGKSELAVALAIRFDGEIINADAMQLYKGLDIITNKIPVAERKDVLHHLLGCIGLDEQPWTVGKFVRSGLKIIEEIRTRGKMPILVGGTHYYTQSLLFRDHLAAETKVDKQAAVAQTAKDIEGKGDSQYEDIKTKYPILEAPTEKILAKLKEVDPVMASRWHPNDRRKIQRSLEIWLQTGRRASDIYAEQKERQAKTGSSNTRDATQDDGVVSNESGDDLRMDTLIFWVHAETATLYDRLNKRVDKMVASGLLHEVQELSDYAKQNPTLDLTSGIWVSIGYKEFLPYLSKLASSNTQSCIGDEAQRSDTADVKKLFTEAAEATKAGTRQYAKRQVRWIRIKLINALQSARNADEGKMYILDASHVSVFQEKVINVASDIADKWLKDEDLPDPTNVSEAAAELLQPKREDLSNSVGKWQRQLCEVCNVVGVTPSDWDLHVNSRRHRRNILKAKESGQPSTKADALSG
ncbi:tRNA dimethylallyltransferase-like protein [Elsinoe fawcettii]|nr:tRNA dimethylallyltransferase-like protein [Elsinoe fawcettii]